MTQDKRNISRKGRKETGMAQPAKRRGTAGVEREDTQDRYGKAGEAQLERRIDVGKARQRRATVM